MIIIDSELKRRAASGDPVRVGMIGAGFMARGIANTIINRVPGLRLAAIANRTLAKAQLAYSEAGVEEIRVACSSSEMDEPLAAGKYVVTEDALLECHADGIDVILDATGAIEFGARLVKEAIAHGKHVVTNAELDATAGPILKVYADRAGVILSGCELLDGVGGYTTYGLCENADIVRTENLLPVGLAEDCRLKREIPKDQAVRCDEVEVPQDSLVYKLREEQDVLFAVPGAIPARG